MPNPSTLAQAEPDPTPLVAAPVDPVLDAYAQAALTGLLANSAIVNELQWLASKSGNSDKVPAQIVLAAFNYADLCMAARTAVSAVRPNNQTPAE